MIMVTWILIYIVSGFSGYGGNDPVATGTVVFHSEESCKKAAAKFRIAFCLEDRPTELTVPPVPLGPPAQKK